MFTKENAKELSARAAIARKKAKGGVQGSRERRKRLENAVWWVANSAEDAKPPNRLAKTMQDLQKVDPVKFNQLLLQVLPAPPKEQALPPVREEDPEKVMLGESLGLLERYLEERRANGPVTGGLSPSHDVGLQQGSGQEPARAD